MRPLSVVLRAAKPGQGRRLGAARVFPAERLRPGVAAKQREQDSREGDARKPALHCTVTPSESRGRTGHGESTSDRRLRSARTRNGCDRDRAPRRASSLDKSMKFSDVVRIAERHAAERDLQPMALGQTVRPTGSANGLHAHQVCLGSGADRNSARAPRQISNVTSASSARLCSRAPTGSASIFNGPSKKAAELEAPLASSSARARQKPRQDRLRSARRRRPNQLVARGRNATNAGATPRSLRRGSGLAGEGLGASGGFSSSPLLVALRGVASRSPRRLSDLRWRFAGCDRALAHQLGICARRFDRRRAPATRSRAACSR